MSYNVLSSVVGRSHLHAWSLVEANRLQPVNRYQSSLTQHLVAARQHVDDILSGDKH